MSELQCRLLMQRRVFHRDASAVWSWAVLGIRSCTLLQLQRWILLQRVVNVTYAADVWGWAVFFDWMGFVRKLQRRLRVPPSRLNDSSGDRLRSWAVQHCRLSHVFILSRR